MLMYIKIKMYDILKYMQKQYPAILKKDSGVDISEELTRGTLCLYGNPKKHGVSRVLVLRIVDDRTALCVRVFQLPQRFSLPALVERKTIYRLFAIHGSSNKIFECN